MPVTLIVEPDPGGHRFQYVRHVVELAAPAGEVVLLTSRGAQQLAEFDNYLADVPVTVVERFDDIYPPTAQMAAAVAEVHRTHDVAATLVMDADQSLKRWWLVAPRAFRGLPRRPRVIFLLTRYPATLTLRDQLGWKHRVAKGGLALLAMSTRTLSRVVTLAGRDDMSAGALVKRVRDPAICGAHSRDRDRIRDELGLPATRRLVGIFGAISDRKNVPLVTAAVLASGDDADLVLAGGIQDEVAAWLAQQPESTLARIVQRDGFLSNDELDRFVAAADVVMIAQNNNGPSGIMGKALAAEVPVLSAGSLVRARELAATGGGVDVPLTVEGVTRGIRALLDGDRPVRPASARAMPPATAASFAAGLLGRDTPPRVVSSAASGES
jgi:glycosyltransferase involved in cell wall biosynthesis